MSGLENLPGRTRHYRPLMGNRSHPLDRRASQFRYAFGLKQEIAAEFTCQQVFSNHHGGNGVT
jgi:hypothetical protein